MSYKITDVELVKKFGPEIAKDYTLAVEFLTLYPSHSLMSFRLVLEGLCFKLSSFCSIDVSNLSLIETINELFSTQIINLSLSAVKYTYSKHSTGTMTV